MSRVVPVGVDVSDTSPGASCGPRGPLWNIAAHSTHWLPRVRRGISLCRTLGIRATLRHRLACFEKKQVPWTVRLSGRTIRLRLGTADVHVAREVFGERIYEVPLRRPPNRIMDLGAHIGLASVFLAERFPNASIIAVEPEAGNFALLESNARVLGRDVQAVLGAVSARSHRVRVVPGKGGTAGFRTEAHTGRDGDSCVPAFTIPELLARVNWDRVDLLKCDIEGAERELFGDCGDWIERVDVIAIELHDRFQPGCTEAVLRACRAFTDQICVGQTVVLARPGLLGTQLP